MRLLATLRALIAIWCLIGVDLVWAGTPGQDTLLFGRFGWVLLGASADMNFATSQYFGLSLGQITVSRASSESEVCNGALTTFPPNVLAVTPGCGAWVWEARTNSVLQNQFQGLVPGVIGSGGVLGTGWTIANSGTGVVITVVGSGFEGGIPYADVSLVGSESAGGQNVFIYRSVATETPVIYGNVITPSWYIKLQSGSNANIPAQGVRINELNSGGGYLNGNNSVITPSTSSLGLDRTAFSYTVSSPSAVYAQVGYIWFLTTSAVNATYRIALPDGELNPNIPATVASAVKAADGTGGVNGAGVYTITGGTCATQPTTNATWAAGVLTIGAVVNAGSCTVLPPSPATLAYLSGAATGWTGATATLTPVDNSAQGFATGPILTSSGAVTRAATNATGPLPSCSNPSVYVAGTPAAPTTYPATQFAALVDDGGTTNLMNAIRAANTGQPVVGTKTQTVTVSGGPWAQSTPAKLTESIGGGSVNGRFSGGSVSTAAATSPPALNRLQLGSQGGISNFNGSIQRIALACGQSLLNR